MFGNLLRLLELLLKQLDSSGEKKRQEIAKELHRIYLDLTAVIERGNAILASLQQADTPVHRSVSIALLSEQHQAIRDVIDGLTKGKVGALLALHEPATARALFCLLTVKGNRVWSTLDQLVSDGEPINPQEWVAQLASRTLPEDASPNNQFTYFTSDVVGVDEVLPSTSEFWPDRSPEVLLIANEDEIAKGKQILREIAGARDQLRAFLIEKFKFEDVL